VPAKLDNNSARRLAGIRHGQEVNATRSPAGPPRPERSRGVPRYFEQRANPIPCLQWLPCGIIGNDGRSWPKAGVGRPDDKDLEKVA
jgi:hypothetical protein